MGCKDDHQGGDDCRDPREPLREDEHVRGLDPDDCCPEGFQILRGYLGATCDDGLWRLYRTLEMDEYFLISDGDIKKQAQLPSGGSLIWVCRNACINLVRRGSADLVASFLDGPIWERYASRPAGTWSPDSMGPAAVQRTDTFGPDCPASTFNKPTCYPRPGC